MPSPIPHSILLKTVQRAHVRHTDSILLPPRIAEVASTASSSKPALHAEVESTEHFRVACRYSPSDNTGSGFIGLVGAAFVTKVEPSFRRCLKAKDTPSWEADVKSERGFGASGHVAIVLMTQL